jgi:hypothetical protein
VKFTSATTGGNSLIYDNGVNVGIGTTTPAYPFHVQSANTSASGFFGNTTPNADVLFAVSSAAAGAGNAAGIVGVSQQNSANAAGVWGQSNNATGCGVIGLGNNMTGMTPTDGAGGVFNGDKMGLYARNTNAGTSQAVYTENAGSPVRVNYYNGTLYKINGGGSVSTVVRDPTQPSQQITLHAPETPEIYFTDYGSGALRNGHTHVTLDPRFAGNVTVDARHPLRIFVQLEGDENAHPVIVKNKTANGFDVVELEHGRSNASFQWQVTANRADEVLPNGRLSRNADVRFETAEPPVPQRSASQRGAR